MYFLRGMDMGCLFHLQAVLELKTTHFLRIQNKSDFLTFLNHVFESMGDLSRGVCVPLHPQVAPGSMGDLSRGVCVPLHPQVTPAGVLPPCISVEVLLVFVLI